MRSVKWYIKRFICILIGCNIQYWHENEYVSGWECERCESYEDITYNESPFKIIEKRGSVFGRIMNVFGWLGD